MTMPTQGDTPLRTCVTMMPGRPELVNSNSRIKKRVFAIVQLMGMDHGGLIAAATGLDVPLGIWIGFLGLLAALLALDLVVFHRRADHVSTAEAAAWSAYWVALGLGFAVVVGFAFGGAAAQKYLLGYTLEKALALDNVLVVALVLRSWQVPGPARHRALFWAAVTALLLRGVATWLGVLLPDGNVVVRVMAAGLFIAIAIELWTTRRRQPDLEHHWLLRLVERVFPSDHGFSGSRLLVPRARGLVVTPLVAVVIVITAADFLFAFGITFATTAVKDPFLVFSSSAFAVLGFRGLFFLVGGLVVRVERLKIGLAIVLGLWALQLLAATVVSVPAATISMVFGAVIVTLLASVRAGARRVQERPLAET